MGTKSKISGIICEFNPLHNGHAALLRHVRHETDGAVVCVMSGNFVQRGEVAVLDKWSRTRLALQNGADLVIELPLPWAMSGAEHFAYGGVFLLDALSCIDELWFGSECGDESKLKDTAEFLLSKDFSPSKAVSCEWNAICGCTQRGFEGSSRRRAFYHKRTAE